MSDIVIRKAREADIGAIINLTGVWEGEGITYGLRKDTPEDLAGCRIWIAERAGHVIGFVAGREDIARRRTSIMPENERYFEIEELYVLPEERKDGLGDLLFRQAETWAKESGYRHIMLSTATKDTMAMLRFYVQKQGMQVWFMRLFKEL